MWEKYVKEQVYGFFDLRFVVFSVLLVAASCAPSTKGYQVVSKEDFRVTVESGGVPVETRQEPLVERYSFVEPEWSELERVIVGNALLNLLGEPVYDARGGVLGVPLLIVADEVASGENHSANASLAQALQQLGLQAQDVVTAVNLSRFRSVEQLEELFQSARESGRASLTLRRGESALKRYYFVRPQ